MTVIPSSYYAAHRDDFLEGLKDFLRIPSISTLPDHRADIDRAAAFVVDELRAMGMENAGLIEGKGHPLVTADWLHAPGKPTVLLYGHYDVQPPDPLDEWVSPPFEPTLRGDDLFARGATDDKGQSYILLKAVEGFLQSEGRLPVNVRFLLEGEEETGGAMLEDYLREHGRHLGADTVVVCDTEMFAPGLPTLCVGLRGMVYTEVEIRAARGDLHSGIYGGVAPNAMNALAAIITKLKGDDGHVTIPGFYDAVRAPSAAEKEAWKRLPFDEEVYRKKEVGATALVGERGFTALERVWTRPTLDVHGIMGGFTGEGAKTVIPAKAKAKVSMRLVPNMDPADIFQRFEAHVRTLAPRGTSVTVRHIHSAPACIVNIENRFIEAAAAALTDVFGKPAVFVRSGGSIPVVGLFQDQVGVPSVLMGFGLPDDNLHAPNEKFHIPNFYRGIEAVACFLQRLGS